VWRLEKNNIKKGFYCCDLNKFNSYYTNQFNNKKNNFPKRFIYTGRYYNFKGVLELWEAFIELCNEIDHDWELWCLGTGTIEGIKHPKIKHLGFIQPADLTNILEQTGVFILPSKFEPWGVVVQEYAAAGYPLLLSKEVGSSESFLTEGINGYSFHTESKTEIKSAFKKMLSLSQDKLVAMGNQSHELAQKITPKLWVSTVMEILNEFRKN
jgi:glycosyltransferase involved in cell wall biosynthesis